MRSWGTTKKKTDLLNILFSISFFVLVSILLLFSYDTTIQFIKWPIIILEKKRRECLLANRHRLQNIWSADFAIGRGVGFQPSWLKRVVAIETSTKTNHYWWLLAPIWRQNVFAWNWEKRVTELTSLAWSQK